MFTLRPQTCTKCGPLSATYCLEIPPRRSSCRPGWMAPSEWENHLRSWFVWFDTMTLQQGYGSPSFEYGPIHGGLRKKFLLAIQDPIFWGKDIMNSKVDSPSPAPSQGTPPVACQLRCCFQSYWPQVRLTLRASAQWSRDWEQLFCEGIWCFCCYNHSVWFLVGLS